MVKRAIFPIIFLFLVTDIVAQNNIGLFDECYYKGTAAYLVPGSYRASSMGLKNDKISALQIPKGMRVTVYSDDNFKGNSLTYTADVECLPDGMNDNVSSIVVENLYNNQPGYGQDYVTFSNDCDGKGYSQSLKPGTYSANKLGSLKLNISSFAISGDLQVRVYTGSDNASGYSTTFTSSQSCLTNSYNDKIRSLRVEYKTGGYNNYPGNNNNYPGNNNNYPGNNNNYPNNQNGYVTFYNDCYSKGYSQTLYPGTYSGSQLGTLRQNISSFVTSGNVIVKVYTESDYATGYPTSFETSQSCLGSSYNDRIRSLTIEYGSGNGNNNYPDYGGSGSYATVYTECNYGGNSLKLGPGNYTGDKLGLMKYNISSMEIPSNLRAKVFINNEYTSGTSYTISENTSCFSNTINNKIASIIIEEKSGGTWNNNNNNYPNNNYPNNNTNYPSDRVTLYSDANFKGLSTGILPGTYNSMQEAGFTDKNLSSVYIPAGFRVILYEQLSLNGKNKTLNESQSSLSTIDWNDKTSSIKIIKLY